MYNRATMTSRTTEREQPVEYQLDPEGRIPTDYTIVEAANQRWLDDKGQTIRWVFFGAEGSGPPISCCNLNIHDDKGYVCFDGVEVLEDEYRGCGYGLAMYLEAILYAHGRNLPFRSQDHSQTEHAVRIWHKLHSLGIAREVEPFTFNRNVSTLNHDTREWYDSPRYTGHYVVDVPE